MANREDPFAEFAVTPSPAKEDPFAEFAVQKQEEDPFAEFATKPKEEVERGTEIKDAEIAAIAQKHKLPPEAYTDYLRSVVEFRGGSTETPVDFAKAARQIGGFVGEAVFYGAPQFIQKKMEDDPRIRAAIDDLGALVDERKTYTRTAAELGIGLLTGAAEAKLATAGVKAGAKAIGKEVAEATVEKVVPVAAGAVIGATAGVSASREGEELIGGAIGAGLGAALPVAFSAASKGISLIRNKGVQKEAQQIAQEMSDSPDMVAKVREEVQKETGIKEVVDTLIQRQVAEPGSKAVANSVNNIDTLLTEVGKERIVKAGRQILETMDESLRAKVTQDLIPVEGEARQMALLVQQKLEQVLPRFVDELGETAGGARDALNKVAARAGEGSEFLSKRFQDLLEKDAHERLLNQRLVEKALGNTGEGGTLNNLLRKIKDYQFVVRQMDRVRGTRLEPLLNNWNEKHNAYTRHMAAKARELESLNALAKKSGITQNELYNALDKPDVVSFAAGPKKEVVEAFKTFFEKAREEANALGLNVAKRENYVPHFIKDRIEISRAMRGRISEIEKQFKINLLSYDQEAYSKAVEAGLSKSPMYRELKDSLDYLYGEVIGTPEKMQEFLASQINPRTAGTRVYSKAAATYRRAAEDVPLLLRETDTNKLAVRWASTTLKHAYMRNEFSEFEKIRDMLSKSGFKADAEVLTDWLTDNLGGTRAKTWGSATQDLQNTLLNMAEKGGTKGQLANWMLEAGPNTFMRFTNAVYPNFLGFNIRSAIQNMTQPFLVTAPELGAVLGPAYILRTLPKLANLKQVLTDAEQYRAAQWSTELQTVLEAGLKRSWIGEASDTTIAKFNKLAMGLYETAERANRAFVVSMGRELAKDVLNPGAGLHKSAMDFVGKLNPGVRNAVKEAIAAQNTKEVERLLINNLLDKTIFQYNRGSMSEFGRTMGPVLSTFSKWPTVLVGDILEAYEREGLVKGTLQNMRKYVGPLVLLASANAALTEGKPFTQEDEQIAALIGGESGLTSMSPLMALRQGIGLPPLVQSGIKVTQGALTGDIDKAIRGLTSLGDAYIPVIPSIMRSINDASKLTTGEETEVRNLETLLETLAE